MEPVPVPGRLVYTVREYRPSTEHLEEILNHEAREGKTLAYIIPASRGHEWLTLVFTSPVSYP